MKYSEKAFWSLIFVTIGAVVGSAIVATYETLRGGISQVEWFLAMVAVLPVVLLLIFWPLGVVIRRKDPSWRIFSGEKQRLLSATRRPDKRDALNSLESENDFD